MNELDYFNHSSFMHGLCQEIGFTNSDIQRAHERNRDYASKVYAIPFTVWFEPAPYQQPRVNYKTGHIYVPEKQKMVQAYRDQIMRDLGPDPFLDGFFPRYSESIIKASLYIQTPKAFSKENKYLAEAKVIRPIVTPDFDNIEKVFNDAIKSFLIYDDAQLIGGITEKYYSYKPRMEFVLYYNAKSTETVHARTIQQRKEKWKELLKNHDVKINPILFHLNRYFNI